MTGRHRERWMSSQDTKTQTLSVQRSEDFLLLEYQMANLKRRLYPLYDKCPVDRPKDAEAEF